MAMEEMNKDRMDEGRGNATTYGTGSAHGERGEGRGGAAANGTGGAKEAGGFDLEKARWIRDAGFDFAQAACETLEEEGEKDCTIPVLAWALEAAIAAAVMDDGSFEEIVKNYDRQIDLLEEFLAEVRDKFVRAMKLREEGRGNATTNGTESDHGERGEGRGGATTNGTESAHGERGGMEDI